MTQVILTKCVAHIDNGALVEGYTTGEKWNGWSTPLFEKEEIAKWLEEEKIAFLFERTSDSFVIFDECGDEPQSFKGQDAMTENGPKHLYPAGTFYWTWWTK